jgi:dTDP-4-dehydrorhamnose 3,5-epimerase
MHFEPTKIADVILIQPQVFGDSRGYFIETYQQERYADCGVPGVFVQDNISFSPHGVLRGLHWQSPREQGKLISVLQGEVYDVAVDLRPHSPTFGEWIGCYLSSENHHQLWIPPGLAHGFCVTGSSALFSYKCTEFYDPSCEKCIRWDDRQLNIDWPLQEVVVSEKDRRGMSFSTAVEEIKIATA